MEPFVFIFIIPLPPPSNLTPHPTSPTPQFSHDLTIPLPVLNLVILSIGIDQQMSNPSFNLSNKFLLQLILQSAQNRNVKEKKKDRWVTNVQTSKISLTRDEPKIAITY